MLKKIWNSREIGISTKVRLFNSNVKSVLLYGAETWRTTKASMKKIQTFINQCLRNILGFHWPEKISNENLWARAQQNLVEEDIRRRRWRWLGHTLHKPPSSIGRQTLNWNSQGQRKRGRPGNTWRQELEKDVKRTGHTWKQRKDSAGQRRLASYGWWPMLREEQRAKVSKKLRLICSLYLPMLCPCHTQ